jgi:hypothetical protein
MAGNQFSDEVQQAFAFLGGYGFAFAASQPLMGYAGGELVRFRSPLWEFRVVLDRRGEIDGYIARIGDPKRDFAVGSLVDAPGGSIFANTDRGWKPRPPFLFGGSTSRRRAVELLAEFVREHAVAILADTAS